MVLQVQSGSPLLMKKQQDLISLNKQGSTLGKVVNLTTEMGKNFVWSNCYGELFLLILPRLQGQHWNDLRCNRPQSYICRGACMKEKTVEDDVLVYGILVPMGGIGGLIILVIGLIYWGSKQAKALSREVSSLNILKFNSFLSRLAHSLASTTRNRG